jgi:hypothetical protein
MGPSAEPRDSERSLTDAGLRLLAEARCRVVSDRRTAMVSGTLRW